MRFCALLVVVGAALVELTGCARTQPRAPVAFEREEWRFAQQNGQKLTTEHYAIYTTMTEDMLVSALPAFVEAAYAHYTALVPAARPPTEPMPIYLFVRRPEWEAFTRRFTGARSEYFLKVRYGGYSERGTSVIEYVTHDVTFPLFAHEGFHQYLHHCVNTRIPAWLNEGLAVYCEGQRWGNHGLQSFDPWFNPMRRNALNEALASNRLYSLQQLLETHPGEVIEGSTEGVATYYAQVWALVLFLQEGADAKYATAFRRLLDELSSVDVEQIARTSHIWSERVSFNFGEALFRTFISEDLDTVQREYLAFVRERFF